MSFTVGADHKRTSVELNVMHVAAGIVFNGENNLVVYRLRIADLGILSNVVPILVRRPSCIRVPYALSDPAITTDDMSTLS